MKTKKHSVGFLTYNGLDGACAAAMGLLKHPGAGVSVSSAAGVGAALHELTSNAPAELHVCGLGVSCPREEVENGARALKKAGTRIFWHCGRGYLEKDRNWFASFCTPLFRDMGTNTAALAKNLAVDHRAHAGFLNALAEFDRNIENARAHESASVKQRDWMDLIEGAMSQYFKYQDRAPYVRAILQLSKGKLDGESRRLAEKFRRTGHRYMLHGRSGAMRELKQRILKCASADRNVLITGESGVGKEHVAHLIREGSPRAMGPFVPVNCALYAGNAGLATSDLFGHTKGAFTGADRDRKGRFAEADGGMLYLDEIGELSLEVQAKLLRVLEDGWVTPEGADAPVKQVDVRVIAATNRDLARDIREGNFRGDLYHRISTLRIHVAPLRERPEDIRPIVEERLAILAKEGHAAKFTKKDYAALEVYTWPGNVRQVLKLVDRAVLLDMRLGEVIAEERALGELTVQAPPHGPVLVPPENKAQVQTLEEVKRDYARQVWELYGRNYTAAAKALGVQTNTLRYSLLAEE